MWRMQLYLGHYLDVGGVVRVVEAGVDAVPGVRFVAAGDSEVGGRGRREG